MEDFEHLDDVLEFIKHAKEDEEEHEVIPEAGNSSSMPQGAYNILLEEAKKNWCSLSRYYTNYDEHALVRCNNGPIAVIKLMPQDTTTPVDSTRDLGAILVTAEKDDEGYLMYTPVAIPVINNECRPNMGHFDIILEFTSFAPALKKILDYVTKFTSHVFLVGRIGENPYEFVVSDLVLRPPSSRSKKSYVEENPEQPMLHLAMRYLLSGSAEEIEKEFFANEFETNAEYAMLIHFFEELYPASVFNAIKRNYRIFISDAYGSDEKKHAKGALRMLTNIDWRQKALSIPDLQVVKKKLDERFYGLTEAKERILEALALIQTRRATPKWGLLFKGQPGTGKTALATFVAQLLGCPTTRLDLNGLNDKETLTGTGRIYDNATIGLLFKKLYEVKSVSQIMVLNELDKADGPACSDTLLSFLDSYGFIDTYIEDAVPTDGVFVIATANDINRISKPLLDRFIVVDIPQYNSDKKKTIFSKYTLPQMLEEQGMAPNDIVIGPEALNALFKRYFKAPGLRDLEQFATRLIGHYCLHGFTGQKEYSETEVLALLGRNSFPSRAVSQKPGTVLTAVKVDGIAQMIPIEAAVKSGTGKFEKVNIESKTIQSYCDAARKCLEYTAGIDVSKFDIAISIPQLLPELPSNSIGLAVFAAILSAISESDAFSNTAFLGGTDILGNTYLDDVEINSYITEFEERDIKTVYLPYGTSQLLDEQSFDGMSLIEAVDIQVLMSFAQYNQ